MNNTQEIAQRIKETAQLKKIKIKELLELSGIKNINAISELSKGQHMSCISLGNIANVLDVSTDYLLGRTDKPNTINADIKTGNIGDNCNNNNNSINISGQRKLDEMSEELLKRFNELPFDEKLEVFNYIKNRGK